MTAAESDDYFAYGRWGARLGPGLATERRDSPPGNAGEAHIE